MRQRVPQFVRWVKYRLVRAPPRWTAARAANSGFEVGPSQCTGSVYRRRPAGKGSEVGVGEKPAQAVVWHRLLGDESPDLPRVFTDGGM